MSLYHKYRPTRPNEMFGNKTSLALIGKMLKKGMPRALLLTGPSGCGKTTIARMIATGGLGCNENEFNEFNSASFNGIDTIRGVMARCDARPLFGDTKVFLYDEAHMISKPAQEAMLKMLEEGPDWVYHIICTTAPEKLCAAIHTRCTEIKVNSLRAAEMTELLQHVCKCEGIKCTKEEFNAIIAVSDGSPRAALVNLEKLSLMEGAMRIDAVGKPESSDGVWQLYDRMRKRDWTHVVEALVALKDQESEPESIRWAMLGIARGQLAKAADVHAARVISTFKFPFYDSKEPGLYEAAFNVWVSNNKGTK